MATKTVISITKPTPAWATNVFRISLLLMVTLNTTIVSAPRISEAAKLDIVYWSGVAVTVIWGISKILGVEIDKTKPWEIKQ